ncbi:Cys-tRNA(Pro) deacylase [Tetragenococcus koreensis]|uniref:Cys-tRNA(Pro)/Cys-tRNA(Cys) deacylase n=1 Tax=Tetragenococcus koreensis TaxID=290335 RepID=A0AAN4UCB4_9ENTE|nr:Cys-tRNA(Pro) deacylase [Tetragenococcus koreensis]AYW44585.1 Cys-tRNA(Pro) deacylase [Tetragenococcus koreensis]MCF1631399.1 Cys-tRNA(Pro) deacylase [Tetragenococcus koreensis]MCF1678417.1 Cys-tRNA(Pro) deacylase [Tetragenococcus koreensis]MDN6598183.1 Cys-tRNA(Pro) deacylase [Tetragenococcus koreensis]MDN6664731.1 Cys-tRNA(Pro) deacylase [Tetragenococcus koreensis]
MSKKKKEKTNAVRLVEQHDISYKEYEYSWGEDQLSAEHVANELNQNIAQIFKTLVAVGNKTGALVAVVPGNQELDLKKIAKISQNKKVEMLHLKDLEKTTGYIRGGCSPIGMKKQFPTYIDTSAQDFSSILVSAGKRGLQIELAPEDLANLVDGTFADITV